MGRNKMIKSVNVENLGLVTVDYNVMSGKCTAALNNKPLAKLDKKTFVMGKTGENGIDEYLYITGNFRSGISFELRGERYYITSPLPWYSYILCVIPFIMVMILALNMMHLLVIIHLGFQELQ